MGFAGYVAICVQLYCRCFTKQKKKTTTKQKSTNGNVQRVTSEADSFRIMKVKTSYTPEDGHVGRNM
jgi:hypothetical protein